MWENTTPSTELPRDFCARIGPLQLGVVLVFVTTILKIIAATTITCSYQFTKQHGSSLNTDTKAIEMDINCSKTRSSTVDSVAEIALGTWDCMHNAICA